MPFHNTPKKQCVRLHDKPLQRLNFPASWGRSRQKVSFCCRLPEICDMHDMVGQPRPKQCVHQNSLRPSFAHQFHASDLEEDRSKVNKAATTYFWSFPNSRIVSARRNRHEKYRRPLFCSTESHFSRSMKFGYKKLNVRFVQVTVCQQK